MGQFGTLTSVLLVCGLAVVQIPLDIRERRLSRRATLFTSAAMFLVVAGNAAISDNTNQMVPPIAASLVLSVIYLAGHRVSQKSLGLGDVFLVFPLTLAVANDGFEPVLYWQLIASSSGAIHAVWVRLSRRQTTIPFGPHLMLSALVVLIASL